MDDNNINNTYRATRNLNTALESPEYKVDDTLDVNIKDVDNNNYVREGIVSNNNDTTFYDEKVEENNSEKILGEEIISNNTAIISQDANTSFINGDISKENSDINYDNSTNIIDNDNFLDSAVNKVTYTPTGLERKKRRTFVVPPELRLLIVLIIVLLVFVFFMPEVYGFFKKIELFFFNR